tara:strand:+ start:49 stop:795 length:747 start_codon:yes stop_codon:yes gene_type:complete
MAYGKIKADAIIYDNSGSDVETTFAVLSAKAPTAAPTFTGTVTVPTPTAGDNSTKAASTAFVVASFAPKASPTFTGTVTVPTASANDSTTKAASTAFVMTELADYLTTSTGASTYQTIALAAPKASPTITGTLTAANVATDGQYIQQEETLTVSSNATTVNCSTGNYFTVQAAGNITFTFGTPPADTKSYAMIIEVDHNSGSLTWPASVKWPADTAPTLTEGKTHQFYFHTNNGGTRWRGGSLVDYVD